MSIAYYISSHGWGHAARQSSVLALLAQQGQRVHVRTATPAKFFPYATSVHAQRYDIGMIQRDAMHFDIPATLAWLQAFLHAEETLIAQEVAFLRQESVRLVVSDMPPIACEIAQRAGVPCVVVTHFTWEWVYTHYLERFPAFAPIISHFTRQYQTATLALQHPFAHPFPHFAHTEPIGLLANPVTRTRHETLAPFGIAEGQKVALISMGGHEWHAMDLRPLADLAGWVFLVTPSLWERVRGQSAFRLVDNSYQGYHNLIAHADILIGKAGGSTITEAIAHKTRMIYALTQDWRESALLHDALQTYGVSTLVNLDEFGRGTWFGMLESLLNRPYNVPYVAVDGAQTTCERLLTFLR